VSNESGEVSNEWLGSVIVAECVSRKSGGCRCCYLGDEIPPSPSPIVFAPNAACNSFCWDVLITLRGIGTFAPPPPPPPPPPPAAALLATTAPPETCCAACCSPAVP
jgi:hypothetical protein